MGFGHTITEYERAKTVLALDRAATVTGSKKVHYNQERGEDRLNPTRTYSQ
jgi:hypothetical protein